MRYRVMSIETGEEILPEGGQEFVIYNDGEVAEKVDFGGQNVLMRLAGPYIVEFAFESVHGEWNYTHSVIVD